MVANAATGEVRELVIVSGMDVLHDPTWAPDGSKIAFGITRDTGPNTYEIQTIAASGGTPTALIAGAGPQWSPDGERIAFVDADGVTAVADKHGLNPESYGVRGGRPSWRPDGKQLVFDVIDDNGWKIESLTLTNGRTAVLFTGAQQPAWSPDGQRLGFIKSTGSADSSHLWIGDTLGSDASQVSELPVSSYAWSPDGTSIAFSSPILDETSTN